ncbi:MAG TPA: hypothetical protein DCR93_32190, partial [Cytophagales bacterium]|nr:hypothetical protein [Cytophagales bacterium]
MQSRLFIIIGAFAFALTFFASQTTHANIFPSSLVLQDTLTEDTRIDSIVIDRNWRTRDKIILRELTFQPGDMVTPQMMKESIDRVWNVGNFATVEWTLDDTTVSGKNIMRLTARDAFTIIPLFAFNGSDQDFTLDVGIIDGNLFGRNIRGRFGYRFATFERKWDIGLGIPRQLLYRNMTLDFNVKQGTQTNFLFADRKRDQGIAYDVIEASVNIGNPWHEDYRYTFSPNLNIVYRAHDIYNIRLDSGITPLAEQEYNARFLRFRIDENIGLVNRKRHQEDRWAVNLAYGLGVGLNDQSPMYHAVVISGEAHKLFNPIVQLSVEGRAGYTSN